MINGEEASTNVTVNDGYWHHTCVIWSGISGTWSVYLNGTLVAGGDNLGEGTELEGGGTLIIGK